MKYTRHTLALLAGLASLIAISCVSKPPAANETTEVTPPVAQPAPEPAKQPEPVKPAEPPKPVFFLIKETVRFADGVVERTVSYEYPAGQAEFASKVSRKPSQTEPVERTVREFRDNRIAVQRTWDAANTLLSESIFTYDGAGRPVTETIKDAKGVVQTVSTWSYNAKGLKVGWTVTGPSGEVKAETSYEYDAAGRLVKVLMTKGGGIATGSAAYTYNTDGLLTALAYYSPTNQLERETTYTYEKGLLIEETTRRADKRIDRRYRYTYGADGEMLTKTLVDASGTARETTTYEYRIERGS